MKYDKQFNRIAAASIKGDESITMTPFSAASGGRMAEQGNKLAFHTSRTRYTSEDGLNHQSQLTIELDTDTMQVTNELEHFQWNHVSHSFDQYVLMDGQTPVYVNHGDAYPRALVLHKNEQDADGRSGLEAEFFDISGDTGANVTGVSMGGVEQSTSHYLVGFNSVNQNNAHIYTSYEAYDVEGNVVDMDKRNVYVYAISKDFAEGGDAAIHKTMLTSHEKTSTYTTTPTLVKVTDDKFVVLWMEYSNRDKEEQPGSLKYVNINGKGQMTSQIYTAPSHYQLSTV